MVPEPALLERFQSDLEALIGREERLGIAVSGGPDSLALLLLAAAARPDKMEAATVDHGLRAEAAAASQPAWPPPMMITSQVMERVI